ncbi:decarboxylating 6-phosphogluconate dehydrogenase [Fundidesulfovibrio butyratiphilus]
MQIGMIGLGRMGMNMAKRLLGAGHTVAAYNRTPARTEEIARSGALAAGSLEDLVSQLAPARVVWLMLPAGPVVDEHVDALAALLAPGDMVVDGGNSRFQDAAPRAERLEAVGVHFVDAGVSGGVWGLSEGYCTMVGGSEECFSRLVPILESLAPPGGYMHCGPVGSGHFVKMIHNGVEYGMMQAYAEGFALLQASPYGERLDFAALSALWNRGSVVRSWLLELCEAMFRRDPGLAGIKPIVEDSGEGRWTVEQALSLAVPAPVLTLSVMERFRSRQENSFADRVLAGLRHEFGGHGVVKSGE